MNLKSVADYVSEIVEHPVEANIKSIEDASLFSFKDAHGLVSNQIRKEFPFWPSSVRKLSEVVDLKIV